MTVGSPGGHLWRHTLPLMLGNFLQLSYNVVDTIIAGRFIGQDALAAEGIAAPIMNLIILAISGLCIGAGILMSEAYGAGEHSKLQKILGNTLMAGTVLGIALAVPGILLTPQLLSLLCVPEGIFSVTGVYVRITFLGVPFTFCYNALAAGLKSVGDSDTPLKFLTFSAVLNALLDLVFLGWLGFGIVCSALTTVFAEAVSALLALLYMLRKMPQLCPGKDHWIPELQILRQILRYGGPTALQQTIQPVCKVLIQGQVNALGISSIAAYNAVTRADDFACIPAQSISSSISTYIAQNRGAGKENRIRPGFRWGIRLEFCYWILIGSLVFIFRTHLVSLFISGNSAPEMIRLGSDYLSHMAWFYLFPAMTNGVQGFFRGMGKMYTTMAATFLQASVRTLCTCILAPQLGITGIAYSCAIGWTMMLLFEVPYYFLICRKRQLSR